MSDAPRDVTLSVRVKRMRHFRLPLVALLLANCVLVASVPLARSSGQAAGTRPAVAAGQRKKLDSKPPQSTAASATNTQPAGTASNAGQPPATAADQTKQPAGGAAVPAQAASSVAVPDELSGATPTQTDPSATTPPPPSPPAATGPPPEPAMFQLTWPSSGSISLPTHIARWQLHAAEGLARTAARLARYQQSTVADEPARPQPLVLINPSSTGGPVHYLVDGQICTLQPGEQHVLGTGRTRLVQFHRGGHFGNAEHQLSGGTYRFVVTINGWQLDPAPAGSGSTHMP